MWRKQKVTKSQKRGVLEIEKGKRTAGSIIIPKQIRPNKSFHGFLNKRMHVNVGCMKCSDYGLSVSVFSTQRNSTKRPSPSPKNTSIIGTTENALLHYTKKQKWSYRMKRVINNKTKKLFPCKYCTTGKLEMSALFTAGLSKLPKQH